MLLIKVALCEDSSTTQDLNKNSTNSKENKNIDLQGFVYLIKKHDSNPMIGSNNWIFRHKRFTE